MQSGLFNDDWVLGILMAALGFLLLAYVNSIKRDVAQAKTQADKAHDALHALQLKVANEHPTVEDVKEALADKINPIIERLASGSNTMRTISDKLDRLIERGTGQRSRATDR